MDSNPVQEETRLDERAPVIVLGIVGSPRKGGNTEIMVAEALEGAR
jgi:hypothetical protein